MGKEKLCIDVRGFTDEKKKRVQDAFFELGYEWLNTHAYQHLGADQYGNVYSDGKAADVLTWGGVLSEQQRKYAITYTDLMRKAGMDESDPDAWPSLQPGDYTTREEIDAYAKREDIELMEAYQRICDAFMAAGAGEGEGVSYWDTTLHAYGWRGRSGVYFHHLPDDVFTRHLTPDQILTAGKQEDFQSEKQAEQAPPKKIGELILGVESTTDLQSIISDYLFLLDSIKDPYARGVVKSQITDLTDLQYKQLNGENENE